MNVVVSLAVLLNIAGYFLYFLQIKRGESNPKLVTWGLWSFLSILNFASYREMTNWVSSLQFFSDAILCIAISFYIYFHKNMKVWNSEDRIVLLLGFLSIIFWWQYREASYANIITCICYIVSFYPVVKEVWKDPYSENPLSWYVCTFAYGFTFWEVYLGRNSQNVDLLSPILLFVLHFLVALLAKRKHIFENPADT